MLAVGFVEGIRANFIKLSIASSIKKHTPIYNITARYSTSRGDWKTLELRAPFTRWFDADGFFVAKPFQQWLASEIPVIGQADPRTATKANQDALASASGIEKDAPFAGLSTLNITKKPSAGNSKPGGKSRASKRDA